MSTRRRRWGLTETLLVVAIVAFGSITLLSNLDSLSIPLENLAVGTNRLLRTLFSN